MDEKELLPGWKTEELIGGGGFGKVYKIKKVNSEDEGEYFAALKIVNIPQSPDEYNSYVSEGYDDDTITNIFQSQLNKLISEFQLMAQMKGNSHIVSYEDHKVIPNKDGTSWKILIRMELLTPISKIDTMSVEDVAKLGIDICKGLEICKKKNIIHRDVKPQNIFVNDFGDYKLGDFGIARALDHATMATRIGTFTYMAPEVYYGRPYDETIDIYALGLVMYWLLNEKRMPFVPLPPASPNHEEIEEAQHSRLSGKTIPFPKNGSKNLKIIVVKACAHDPQDRFLSALEMRRALEKVYVEIKGDETTVLSNTDLLDDSSMPTVLLKEENDLDDKIFADKTELIPKESEQGKQGFNKKLLLAIPICVLILFLILNSCNGDHHNNSYSSDNGYGDLDFEMQAGLPDQELTFDDTTSTGDAESMSQDEAEETTENASRFLADLEKDLKVNTWSAWTTAKMSNTSGYEVQTKTQYSYRTIVNGTSYSDWSSWSGWGLVAHTESNLKQVETKTVYYYPVYRIRCECGMVSDEINLAWVGHIYQKNTASNAADTIYWLCKNETMTEQEKAKYVNDNTEYSTVYETKTLTTDTPLEYNSGTFVYGDEEWYSDDGSYNTKTQYRYRTRTESEEKIYGDWSAYSDTKVTVTDDREVRTRTMYRYKKTDV